MKPPSQQIAEAADRLNEPAKKDAGLADGYCARCDQTVMVLACEYPYESPEHYDGVSEYQCPRCGRREGRWTGNVLTDGASEPRLGEERQEAIDDNHFRIGRSVG